MRPFGALYFGHIGDRYGRKRAFLQTIILMGAATTAIGFLPGIRTIGVAAPILLVLIRVIQGFAMGGEYGGAAVYVAEHADPAPPRSAHGMDPVDGRGRTAAGAGRWCWPRASSWERPSSRPGAGAFPS